MSNFEKFAIEQALRTELGGSATFWQYPRENRTPMTFVLDEVERHIGPRFSVYWVDGGFPEVFCLGGFSPSPVVFSTRYLSLTAFIRHLFVDSLLEKVLVDVAERTALKVMAELALRRGDPDYATLAFIKSVTKKGIWLNDDDQVMALEYEPKNEAYMAIWFYGLVHELGHLQQRQNIDFPVGHVFSESGIVAAITVALSHFTAYPESFKEGAIERAKRDRSRSVLGIDHLRSEGLADIFAASLLFKATFEIMREINQKRFEVLRFVSEMVVFLNIIAFIDRCRRVASIASSTSADPEASFEMGLHPVAVMVRSVMQRQYFYTAVTEYLHGPKATQEQLNEVTSVINKVYGHHKDTIRAVDSGISRAMEFSLFPDRRDNDWALLEEFRNHLPGSTLALMEARRFCELADTVGADGKLLKALKGVLEDPSKPLTLGVRGDLVYLVPWVDGPDGFERPFGLDTKHGHLVFVFHHGSELYDAFCKSSAGILQSGYALTKAVVVVPRKEQLGRELAARMPTGQRFGIVIEGTDPFADYMKELSDGTIWTN